MAEVIQVTTAPGLAFDVLIDGPEQGAPVLLLHGFAESFHTWDVQIAALAGSGYRAIAPSQRGYSPGARPHAADTNNYIFDRLVDACEALGLHAGMSTVRVSANLGRPEAYGHLKRRGFRTATQAVAMHRPNEPGYARPGVWVIDDWR